MSNSADQTPTRVMTLNISGCMSDAIGDHGLSKAQLDAYLEKLEPEMIRLRDEVKSGSLPLLTIPRETEDIDAAAAAYNKLATDAKVVVFFGTGGSSLGGQTLAQMAGWNIPGASWPRANGRPRVRFYDNLDGGTLIQALAGLDLARTRFIVTSKSGGTAETLAQAIAALSAVKAAGLGDKIPNLFLGISEPTVEGRKNGLRDLFAVHDIPMLAHHTGIGGRYSCLTNVGLMAAIARGLDAHAIRKGAQGVIDTLMLAKNAAAFPPAVGGAVAVAMNKEKNIRTLVMMPYADRLGSLASWFVQLWAESLGKGGEGTTPVSALGPLDQHSQLQLFMDGPREHLITVLRIPTEGVGPVVDAEMAIQAGAEYMAGKAIGDVVEAQAHAVPEALGKAGRPVRVIDIPKLDEVQMGMLLMHFMIETILAGRLLKIDPFDQPAVELAKILTRERLVGG